MHSIYFKKITHFVLAGIIVSSFKAHGFDPVSFDGGESPSYSAQWESFTTAVGEPGNTPDVEGSDELGILTQTAFGASVTGSGNIYNPAAASEFELAVTTGETISEMILQVRSIGDLAETVSFVPAGSEDSLIPESREVSRVSGGFGDIVVMHYHWALAEPGVSAGTVRFAAASSHLSLDSVKLDILAAPVQQTWPVSLSQPIHDQWNYSFNFTPGIRGTASLFRSPEEGGMYWGGIMAMVFSLEGQIPDEATGSLRLQSARLRVMTSTNFEVPYDTTYDSVLSSLPEDAGQFEADSDPGRPIEAYGILFNNEFDILSWEETAPVSSGDPPSRNVAPARFDPEGNLVDASLVVDYASPAEYMPFAFGTLDDGTAPGELIPEDTWMSFEFDISNPGIQKYFTDAVEAGRIGFVLTSLNSGGQGARTYPEFYTRDSLIGEAPQLELVFVSQSDSGDSAPVITSLTIGETGVTLVIENVSEAGVLLEWTDNLMDWNAVEGPSFENVSEGVVQWTDQTPATSHRFYKATNNPSN